jgi:hypothetical protein
MSNSSNPPSGLGKTFDFRPSPELVKQLDQIREEFQSVVEGSQQFSEKMREAFKLTIPQDFKFPSWEEQDEAYRARLKMLAEHGWYAAMDFPLETLNRADAMFREGKEIHANAALTELFHKKAPDIIREITELYPETSTLMARALRAHQEEDYVVSVMILLAQAEGIWGRHAKVELSPYSKGPKNRTALKKAIDDKAAQLPIRAYWELLLDESPMNRSFERTEPAPEGLNRHAVMHGASLNCGTKMNSARALSWLSYVGEIRGFFGLFERKGSEESSATD